ncbi:MAG: mechanosensitive ion channel family protein [Cellulosilyticaceae bacterium]
MLIIMILKAYTLRLFRRKNQDLNKAYMSKKIIGSSYLVIGIIAILIIWYDSSQYIVAFIGLFSAGMAIAMKDILLNVIGGLYILWASPFKVGDRIEIAGQMGDVIDVRLMQFSMLEIGNRISGEQSTGRIIHIPNMQIFNFPLANYEKGFRFIWNEMVVPIDRTSNWEMAKEMIYHLLEQETHEMIEAAQSQIEEAGKKYLIYYNNLTPIIYTELKDNHVVLTIRYLCEPRKARMTEHQLWEAILKTFENHPDIRLG